MMNYAFTPPPPKVEVEGRRYTEIILDIHVDEPDSTDNQTFGIKDHTLNRVGI